jgi:hypothetical protein
MALGQGLFVTSPVPFHGVGEQFAGNNNTYRYVKAGTLPLVVGNMIQAPAQNTDHDQLVVAVAPSGARAITVTTGASGLTANQYGGGWAMVDTGAGLGTVHRISGHLAAGTTASCVLNLDDPLRVDLTATSRVTLVANPYNGVIQAPITTLTGTVLGSAISPIPAGEYGWIQTAGVAAVLIAGTPGVGLAVVVPGTAAGAVVVDGGVLATQVVGSMMATGVDGKVLPVRLDLD